jgi:methyltransferase
MTPLALAAGVILGLLISEWQVSRRHEQALLARGAAAPPGDVYAAMAVVYPLAFVAMLAEGLWRLSGPLAADPSAGGPSWFASGVVLVVGAKALKYWAIGALGDRWTFRVLVEPGRPLVRSGPYRYVSHPNYVAVVGELVGVAMMAGARWTGPIALVLFGLLLWGRVRFEARAIAAAERGRLPPTA